MVTPHVQKRTKWEEKGLGKICEVVAEKILKKKLTKRTVETLSSEFNRRLFRFSALGRETTPGANCIL